MIFGNGMMTTRQPGLMGIVPGDQQRGILDALQALRGDGGMSPQSMFSNDEPAIPGNRPGGVADISPASAEAPPMPVNGRRGLFGRVQSRAASVPLPANTSADGGVGPATPAGPSGFDYEGAMASMLPQQKKKHGFGKTLLDILEIAAPALMAVGGDTQGANAFIARQAALREDMRRRQLDAQAQIAKWRHDDWALKQGADLRASAPFTIGRERLQFDPSSGQVSSLYKGDADFEDYAASQGLEPGTPEYFQAVEDYVLRGNGPSAMGYDMKLDDYRTNNRLKVVGAQQKGRERVRSMPTYRDLHPAPPRTAAPRAPRQSARPTATGPNGQKVEWDGKAWVPVQ